MPRRLVDRISSLLRPVRRFRCCNSHCAWVGNLAATDRRDDTKARNAP